MARIAGLDLTGYSGHSYNFSVYPLHQEFNDVGGVYCISRRYKNSFGKFVHHLIYIGMTGSMCDRFADHHKDQCFVNRNADCISFLGEGNEQRRRAIETDLIRKYSPPCNG